MKARRSGKQGERAILEDCRARVADGFGHTLPKFGLVLGSGFQDVASTVEVKAELPFGELPGFPAAGVQGHAGRLILGRLAGLDLLLASGRAHYYEGHSMDAVNFPIRLMAECGVTELLLTNAAGGINRGYRPGDFMIFSDHINLMGVNPLRGRAVEDGRCFLDLSDTYCGDLRAEFKRAARREGVCLREGVYLGVSGPSYETPAEIRAFRKWGADAVGMSTIPEAVMARYCGLRVAAISCITNPAAGMRPRKLSHDEVLAAGRENASRAARLLRRFAAGHGRGAQLHGRRRKEFENAGEPVSLRT